MRAQRSSRLLGSRASILAAFLSVMGLPGCASDESLSPVPSATTQPTAAPTPTSPPDPVIPKRTVVQRNPFGNVAETENLLFDGDFEWSSPFSDEYGWFQGGEATVTDVVVGAACRSGVKCARLKGHQGIVGIGVAAKDAELEAWVWVRFDDPATPCTSAKVTLIDRSLAGNPLTNTDPDVHLVASDAPDQNGWCRIWGTSPKRDNRTFLNVLNSSSSKMLVDDAVVKKLVTPKPTPQGLPSPVPGPISSWIPTAEEAKNLEEVRALLTEYSRPHDGPPTRAQKAFEALHPRGEP